MIFCIAFINYDDKIHHVLRFQASNIKFAENRIFFALKILQKSQFSVRIEKHVLIEKNEIDLHDACLTDDSSEVAVVVAGYIAKKLKERSKCLVCKLGLFNMEIKAISIFFHVVG